MLSAKKGKVRGISCGGVSFRVAFFLKKGKVIIKEKKSCKERAAVFLFPPKEGTQLLPLWGEKKKKKELLGKKGGENRKKSTFQKVLRKKKSFE